MAPTFTIKRGDTHIPFTATLLDINGAAVNLTNASTVTFVMRSQAGIAAKVSAAAAITNPTGGTVSYTLTTMDSNTAGRYDAEVLVTWNDTTVSRYPEQGYFSISVEEDLSTPGGARLVSLEELRDALRMSSNDTTFDARLLRLLDAITPAIEHITGPILQRVYQDETYDGGSVFISVRHRPIVQVTSVTEFRGPIPYVLTQVPTPDLGSIYSYMFEPAGRIVRRTVGGGMTPFPAGPDSVWITYTAGQATVPPNVREAAVRMVKLNWQPEELGGGRAFGGGGSSYVDDNLPTGPPIGFAVPGSVRELLVPNRRHPSIA